MDALVVWILCIMMTSASGVTTRHMLLLASKQECHDTGIEYLQQIGEMGYDVSIHGTPEIACIAVADL